MPPYPVLRCVLALGCAAAFATSAAADPNVVVSGRANPGYTERKFAGPAVRRETYVIGEGSFFGGITADRSLDRMPFRRIAESLAPELARQQFWPAQDLASADLLIVVHWGVTTPHQSWRDAQDVTTVSLDPREIARSDNLAADQLLQDTSNSDPNANTSDSNRPAVADSFSQWQVPPDFERMQEFSDEAARNYRHASNAQLLGYTRALREMGRSAFGSAEEDTLRGDLSSERYLIVLCAYDVKTPAAPGQKRRPVWITHVNIRAAGNNFSGALARMGHAGADFFGRSTDAPTTVRPKVREGRASFGPLIILGMDEPTSPKKK
jgi:hypothetical protein